MPANVQIDKQELLHALMDNRQGHREKFVRAQEVYRERIIAELDSRLADARAGREIDVEIRLPVPHDHTDDYDREIRMLKMETEDTVTLSSREFDQLVMDNWGWKASFETTNSVYAVS